MIWDIFISIFTMAIIFLESLKICFYVEDKKNFITSIHTFNSVVLIIYQIDICKNFITGILFFFFLTLFLKIIIINSKIYFLLGYFK